MNRLYVIRCTFGSARLALRSGPASATEQLAGDELAVETFRWTRFDVATGDGLSRDQLVPFEVEYQIECISAP